MKLKKRIAAMGAAVMMAVSMMSMSASAFFTENEHTYSRSDYSTKKAKDTEGVLSEIATLVIDVPLFGKHSCNASGHSEFVFNKKKTKYSAKIVKDGHMIIGEYTGSSVSVSFNNGSFSSEKDKVTYKTSSKEFDYSIKGKATRLYDFDFSSSVNYEIYNAKKKKLTSVVVEAGYDW